MDDFSFFHEEKPMTVTELTKVLSDTLENTFFNIYAIGEVSNFSFPRASQHVYFTLKDENAQISCAWFGGKQKSEAAGVQNGAEIEVRGKISFYSGSGRCQIIVSDAKPVGTGILQQRFEELYNRLDREGLFSRPKKQLPLIPRCVGVITSVTGAAIKDFCRVAYARFPLAHIRVFNALVQGKGAERELANGIKFFNAVQKVDVILLTRGGGSLEDLWPFNEEILARTIAESKKPVISAVGHERDYMISDYVADCRAPTPTGAAEIIFPEYNIITASIQNNVSRIKNIMEMHFEKNARRLSELLRSKALARPEQILNDRAQRIDWQTMKMANMMLRFADAAENRFSQTFEKLKILNPSNVLKRGYSIIIGTDGKAVLSPDEIPPETPVTACLAEGKVTLKRA